jgi:hypothetical protein
MTNVQLNLQEITETYGITYNSIDVRTVALRLAASWVNILTVVRVSHDPPALVDNKHAELKSLHVLPRLEDFGIFLSSVPFSAWQGLCNGLRNSTVLGHSVAVVRLTGPLDIYSKNGDLHRYHNVLRANPAWDWPTCEIGFPYTPNQAEQFGFGDRLSLLADRKLSQQISQFGHSNVFDAIDAFMEFTSPFDRNPGWEFYVSVPVFAAIDTVEVNPDGNILTARARFHQELPKVRFFAVFRDAPSNTGLLPKATLPLEIHGAGGETRSGIREVIASVALPPGVKWSDYVEVKAVSKLGDIDANQWQVRSLLPARHVQPLYHALASFRSHTQFRQALAYPQATPRPRRQPWRIQDYFERDVCWFLSYFGFATVMLGEHETLRDAESKFERGSLDILAFNESRKIMLLVACTLNAPKDEDFTNLTTLRTIFLEEILTGSNVSIIPVIFTGLKTSQPYWEQTFADHYLAHSTVPIFDGNRREAALVLLENKREQEFFSFLSNPATSSLG